jgi:RimJ/RimL family protein N-acetyltransferase
MLHMLHDCCMVDIIAETDRLVLRTSSESDIEKWMRVLNTPAVTRHLGGMQERHQVEAKFARVAAAIAQHGLGFWLVQLKETGALIGDCGIALIDTPAAPDALQNQWQIGWRFGEKYWGKGFAAEAAQAVFEIAFRQAGLPILFAQTSENNQASWRLMEKLGMERAKTLDYVDPDYPPEENPTIVFQLKRVNWGNGKDG